MSLTKTGQGHWALPEELQKRRKHDEKRAQEGKDDGCSKEWKEGKWREGRKERDCGQCEKVATAATAIVPAIILLLLCPLLPTCLANSITGHLHFRHMSRRADAKQTYQHLPEEPLGRGGNRACETSPIQSGAECGYRNPLSASCQWLRESFCAATWAGEPVEAGATDDVLDRCMS